jgi:hypothetical protein
MLNSQVSHGLMHLFAQNNTVFAEYIKPICLPPNYMNPPNNETLWIAGWGSDENDG